MSESLGSPLVQQFLAGRMVAVLATVQADGSPLAMPMWFLPDPDGLTMISVTGLQKLRNLERDGRVAVVAEAGTAGDIAGVTIQGRVRFVDAGSAECRGLTERLVVRYHPHLERRWGGRTMPGDRVMFRILPTRVRSWGLGPASPAVR